MRPEYEKIGRVKGIQSKMIKWMYDILETFIFVIFVAVLFWIYRWEFDGVIIDVSSFVLAFIGLTYIHELAHYTTARSLGHTARIHMRHCNFPGDIKRNDFIWIAIMPFLVNVLLFLVVILFQFYPAIWIPLMLMKLLGCRGDLYLIKGALRFRKEHYLRQNGDKVEDFLVLSKK